MNIALVNHHGGFAGGIERYVYEMAVNMSRLGHSVYSVEYGRYSPPSLDVLLPLWRNRRAVERFRNKHGLDVVHSQGAEMLGADVITCHSCHKAAIHAAAEHRREGYMFLKQFEPRSRLVQAIEEYNYRGRHYRRLIAVSEGAKQELIRYYQVPSEDITVIPNGVNTEEYGPTGSLYRYKTRQVLGLTNDDTALILVANEFKRKGLRPTLEALRFLPDRFKLIVVGGNDLTYYRNIAMAIGVSKRVFFVGETMQTNKYYSSADIFVMPTEYEASSLAVLEAMASHLPVLVTNVNGMEVVEEGVNGFFIQRYGSSIADAALEAEKNKWMGTMARLTAEKNSWLRVAEQTLAVYDGL